MGVHYRIVLGCVDAGRYAAADRIFCTRRPSANEQHISNRLGLRRAPGDTRTELGSVYAVPTVSKPSASTDGS